MPNEARVAILNDEGRCLLEAAKTLAACSSPPQAKVAFEVAIDGNGRFEARNDYGCYLMQIGCCPEAIEQFSILLSMAKQQANRELESVAANNLAAVHRLAGNIELAARFQQQSLAARSYCNAEADNDQLACDLTNRANDAILAGEFDLAERLIRRSLDLEISNGSISGQAVDWGSLGVVLGLNGDPAAGVRCLWQAYRLHLELQEDYGAGCDLMNLAELFHKLGRLRGAANALGRAASRLEKAGAIESAKRARLMLARAERLADVLDRDPLLN